MAKILLIEDDLELAESLQLYLGSQGHLTEHVASGEDGLQMLSVYEFDVVVLDWMLPKMTGVSVCKEYRRQGGSTPVIFLTGQGTITDKEQGFDVGADDYLTKPFDYRELAARIRGLLRRPPKLSSPQLMVNGVSLDPQTRVMTVGEKELHLRGKEAALLEYLMRHPNVPFEAQALLSAVWPSDTAASVDTIRSWMRNLRLKLAEAGKENFIKTVPGAGYVIESSKT